MPNYITFSNIIIDDIVLWDGTTYMGTLGGAGTHALIGMRVWSDSLGYAAVVGSDFEDEQRQQLLKLGIDPRGIREEAECKTARAWQILEQDDRRGEIFRTAIEDFLRFTPQFDRLPSDYVQAKGVHIMWGQSFDELLGLIAQWREVNPDVHFAWEPALEFLNGTAEEFGQLFRRLSLVSPDLEQAQSMTKLDNPVDMAKELLSWGAPIVAIRMGAEGSVVATDQGECWQIPAVPPSRLIDVTGAGNAYCGGFLVGLGEGLPALESALQGAVSASFALEQFGVPDWGVDKPSQAKNRLVWAMDEVKVLTSTYGSACRGDGG